MEDLWLIAFSSRPAHYLRAATGSPGSRAWSFSACLGSWRKNLIAHFDSAGPRLARAIALTRCCLPCCLTPSASRTARFRSSIPSLQIPLSNGSGATLPPPSHGSGPEWFAIRVSGSPHGFRFVARNGGLRRRQPGDRHAVGRARNVIHPHPVTEHHRAGLAAMLAADADFQARARSAAQLHGVLDQLAHALLIENRERIVFEDLRLLVVLLEPGVIVARQAHGRLRQIV